jgi:feruloyl esterase
MFRFVAHEDPAWDRRTFDLDRDTSLIDKKAGFIDAVNPDLSAFRARGGKLLIYHGWNDGGSPPRGVCIDRRHVDHVERGARHD